MNVQTYFADSKVKSVNLKFEDRQIEFLMDIFIDEERQYLEFCKILDEPANLNVLNFFKQSREILASAELLGIGAVLEAGYECYFVLQSIFFSLLTSSECKCIHKEQAEILKVAALEFEKAINKLHENKVSYFLRGVK